MRRGLTVAVAAVAAGAVVTAVQAASQEPEDAAPARSHAVVLTGTTTAPPPGRARSSTRARSTPRTPTTSPGRRLVVRGATVYDGTDHPPRGPQDIVIAGDTIERVVPHDPEGSYDGAEQLDAGGMYALPGLIDLDGVTGGDPMELGYAAKLWLAHGVTTVRGVSLPVPAGRSEMSPAVVDAARVGERWGRGPVRSAAAARAWVAWASQSGVDGVVLDGAALCRPSVLAATLRAARARRLPTSASFTGRCATRATVGRAVDGRVSELRGFLPHVLALATRKARLPRADGQTQAGLRRIAQAELDRRLARPGSRAWRSHLRRLKRRGVALTPQLSSHVVARDVRAARDREWLAAYGPASLRRTFEPLPRWPASFYRDWGSDATAAWATFYDWWMALVRDYARIGGRVDVGSGAGKRYQLPGFSTISELELLREAGLSRFDTLRAGTLDAARTLYGTADPPTGTLTPGRRADLLVVPADPFPQRDQPDWRVRGGGFKVLYGTGHARLDRTTLQMERVGAVRWTVQAGRVHDAAALLADVREQVARGR